MLVFVDVGFQESSDLFEQSRASVVSSGTLSKCVNLRCVSTMAEFFGLPKPWFTVGRLPSLELTAKAPENGRLGILL